MEYRKCHVKSDKEVINMVYLKYTSKYVCFMLHVCDNLVDFHTSCFLFKSFSSFPYLSRRAEISPCNQPLINRVRGLYGKIFARGFRRYRPSDVCAKKQKANTFPYRSSKRGSIQFLEKYKTHVSDPKYCALIFC